jgi:cytochrome c-type biogenesis protein CcmH/NrfG
MGDEAAQTRQRHARRRKERRGKQTRKPKIDGPDAGVINFVSGAALLGVALAGSVAALGWWRRTSAALNSSA